MCATGVDGFADIQNRYKAAHQLGFGLCWDRFLEPAACAEEVAFAFAGFEVC